MKKILTDKKPIPILKDLKSYMKLFPRAQTQLDGRSSSLRVAQRHSWTSLRPEQSKGCVQGFNTQSKPATWLPLYSDGSLVYKSNSQLYFLGGHPFIYIYSSQSQPWAAPNPKIDDINDWLYDLPEGQM